jgi:hypothetical protein
MTQLENIIELDKHVSILNRNLLIEETQKPYTAILTDNLIKDLSTKLPKYLIVIYLDKINTLIGGTQRVIEDLCLKAVPAYIGNGEPDDPSEYSEKDKKELDELVTYINYLWTLESIFTNELFDRESFINNI